MFYEMLPLQHQGLGACERTEKRQLRDSPYFLELEETEAGVGELTI